jgi:predicted nucleotidyltransferase
VTSVPVRPRDFVETGDGLFFAVVSTLMDAGRHLTSLRYVREQGRLRKLDTESAAALLRSRHGAWVARSGAVDAEVHLVPAEAVVKIHRPEERLAALVAAGAGSDTVAGRAVRVVRVLEAAGADPATLGLSGSLLLGAEGPASDIDLVAYGRRAFGEARGALAAAVMSGIVRPLEPREWRSAWERRGSPLSLDEYVWHEQRKGTKAVSDDTRIDLSLVADASEQLPLPRGVRKRGRARLVAAVTDASAAFDLPARYLVSGAPVVEVMSFTPTYAGQVRAGEVLEADGWVEEDGEGVRRLVVGTSREAPGEYVRNATARGSS